MLYTESVWIGEKIKQIVAESAYPILNVGSSTKQYRTQRQAFIQDNIFSQIPDEKKNVVHLDMKKADGVDVVGDLYDEFFLQELKKYKFKVIMFNNVLMYLEEKQRKRISQILENILEKDGYLIITNSLIFPPAHDPVEAYYRANPQDMYQQLFQNFKIIDQSTPSVPYNFCKYLKQNPKVIPVKIARLLMPFYKYREWKFMLNYYLNSFNKDYSATCLFLQKK